MHGVRERTSGWRFGPPPPEGAATLRRMPVWGPDTPDGRVVVWSSSAGPTAHDAAVRLGMIWSRLHRGIVLGGVILGVAAFRSGVPALGVASLALSLMIVVFVRLSQFFNALPTGIAVPDPGPSHGGALQAQAAALVTLQGVVLGLVLALGDQQTTVTVKVAGLALVIGVLIGLLLVTMTAMGATGRPRLMLSAMLFQLTVWAGGYGLLCLASSLALES